MGQAHQIDRRHLDNPAEWSIELSDQRSEIRKKDTVAIKEEKQQEKTS